MKDRDRSNIPWTDHTFNPWWGCAEVSPACAHCYARHLDRMWQGGRHWGPGSDRRHLSEAYWRQPLKWARDALAEGARRRVFTLSMGDVFEDRPELEARRRRLFALIEATGHALDWLILTKRPENAARMAPPSWAGGWPPYAWFGVTVEDPKREALRAPHHLAIPARRFLSIEPLLAPVTLAPWAGAPGALEWVIVGGESGAKARPFHLEWAEDIQGIAGDQGWAFFMKQVGDRPFVGDVALKGAGRMGKELDAWPAHLRVRELPPFGAE